MSTKPSSGKSNPTPETKNKVEESGRVVAPKPTQKPGASRPLGVTSSGSVKVTT